MKKFLIPIIAVMVSLYSSTAVFANHIFVGDGVEKIISYDEDGNKVITLVFNPNNTPDSFKNMDTEITKTEQIPSLTEAPVIGETLAHILDEKAPKDAKGADKYMEAYKTGLVGQCTWYAAGRFKEVYGIELFNMGNAKNWIDNSYKCEYIKAITDLSDVPEQAIAVFKPTEEFKDMAGHVVFIEYVERDKNGNPLNIYYTDANGIGDLRKNEFDLGYDGTVKMSSFQDFKNPYGLTLIGYIIPAI